MNETARRLAALGLTGEHPRGLAVLRRGQAGRTWVNRGAAWLGGAGAAAVARGVAPGPAGLAAALLIGVGAAVALERWVRKLEPAAIGNRRRAIADGLPLCLELLAACVEAGLPVGATLPVLAESLEGPLADELAAVHRLLALGATREQAWSRLTDTATGGPDVAAAVRAILAAERRGTRLAATLTALAAEQRETAGARALAAAHRAGVHAVAPLGLCFLPAFVLVGVVPVVASAFSGLLGGR